MTLDYNNPLQTAPRQRTTGWRTGVAWAAGGLLLSVLAVALLFPSLS